MKFLFVLPSFLYQPHIAACCLMIHLATSQATGRSFTFEQRDCESVAQIYLRDYPFGCTEATNAVRQSSIHSSSSWYRTSLYPFLAQSSFTIGERTGNQNGVFEPGEILAFTVTVQNETPDLNTNQVLLVDDSPFLDFEPNCFPLTSMDGYASLDVEMTATVQSNFSGTVNVPMFLRIAADEILREEVEMFQCRSSLTGDGLFQSTFSDSSQWCILDHDDEWTVDGKPVVHQFSFDLRQESSPSVPWSLERFPNGSLIARIVFYSRFGKKMRLECNLISIPDNVQVLAYSISNTTGFTTSCKTQPTLMPDIAKNRNMNCTADRLILLEIQSDSLQALRNTILKATFTVVQD
ncbi:MAG: hypothetical protein KDC10_06310 [Calditrichaeota bacterium]|nr:hypothetical protein [Calditrichota bacterium]